MTEHAQAYQQNETPAFPFLTPFQSFSPAEHIFAPTGQNMDLHQKVTCPEDLLQSLPIAITRRGLVISHVSMLQEQAANNASGCLSASVLCLTVSRLQMRKLRFCCPAVVCLLQPTRPAEGSFSYVLVLTLLSSFGGGHGVREAAPLPLPRPLHPSLSLIFLSFTFS